MNVRMYRWLKIKKVRKVDAGLKTCVVMKKCGEKNSFRCNFMSANVSNLL